MKERKLNWILFSVAAVLLLVTVVTFIGSYRAMKQEAASLSERAEEYNGQLSKLYAEERSVKQRLQEIEAELASARGAVTVSILCAEPNERILTDILPRLEKVGYTGMVALKADAFPGDPYCLSVEQLQSLLDKGWKVCLSVTDATDLRTLYLRAEEAGFSPVAAFFPETRCTLDMEKRVASFGMEIVMQRVPYEPLAGVCVQAFGTNESGVRNSLLTAINADQDFVLTVGYRWERDQFVDTSFDSMLDVLERYRKDGSIRIDTVDDGVIYRQNAEAERTALRESTAVERAELEERLAELQQKIIEVGMKAAS